ncbi:MAG: DUF2357 domain-containing protein [Bacteroidota bacterium]
MTHTTVVETERVRVEWRGPHPVAFEVEGGGTHDHAEGGTPLREETTYSVLVQAKDAVGSVAVRHPDPVVTAGVQASADGRTIHGTISTRSHVGTLRLDIEADGERALVLSAEVAPTKIDAAAVAQMRDEVEGAVAGLALRYLRATTQPAAPEPTSRVEGSGWLRLVEAALHLLDRALAEIARAPQSDIQRTTTVQRTDAIRRPDPALVRALRAPTRRDVARGTGTPMRVANRVVSVPHRARARQTERTLDTPEHRWLRSVLDQTHGELQALHQAETQRRPYARRALHLEALNRAAGRVRALLRLNPLTAATPGTRPAPTLRLRRARGYRTAYEAAQVLRFGLDLGVGRLRVSLVDLAALYEQWTYLTVAQMLADVLAQPLDAQRFFVADAVGLHLRLRQGHPHALRFPLGDGGTVRLAYQPRFGRPALLPQRPDLLLTVEHPGQPPRRIVLDAKYRRDDSAATTRRYGLPAPPADALADLHRYRDAIRDARGQRIINQAVALYPFAPDDVAQVETSRLWQSIGTLGVGAIPVLPQTKQHLHAWLRGAALM